MDARIASIVRRETDLDTREAELEDHQRRAAHDKQILAEQKQKCTDRSKETKALLSQAQDEKSRAEKEMAKVLKVRETIHKILGLPNFGFLQNSKPKVVDDTIGSLEILSSEMQRLLSAEECLGEAHRAETAQLRQDLDAARRDLDTARRDLRILEWQKPEFEELHNRVKELTVDRDFQLSQVEKLERTWATSTGIIREENTRLESELAAVREQVQAARADCARQKADFDREREAFENALDEII